MEQRAATAEEPHEGLCLALHMERCHSEEPADGRETSHPKSAGDLFRSWCKKRVPVPLGMIVVVAASVLTFAVLAGLGCRRSQDVPVVAHLEPCPTDWLYIRRKCYYLSTKEEDWDKSQSFCASHSASLALMDTKQELDLIMQLVCVSWIGLRKNGDEFQWANGTSYNNTLFTITDHGECVYIESDRVLVSGCFLQRNYICNKRPYV